MAEHVLLGDAAVGTGAGDPIQVELVFFGDAADERRGTDGAAGFGFGRGRLEDGRGSRFGGACAAAPTAPPMTATTVLISTVAPSGILISVRIPATGEGISASTLSVEISKSGSSFSTWSPTLRSHLVMVPSTIDSPICGMTMSKRGLKILRQGRRLR